MAMAGQRTTYGMDIASIVTTTSSRALKPGSSVTAGDLEAKASVGPRYRWYVLGVLTLVYAIHMLDRTVVNVVLEPLKKEFLLSDTQLGLLSGFAYGAVFSLFGIFMGLVVDRTNRKNLLGCILVIWSGLTALSGLAGSYLALLSARMGIAAAESGGTPAIMSLICSTNQLFAGFRASLLALTNRPGGRGTLHGQIPGVKRRSGLGSNERSGDVRAFGCRGQPLYLWRNRNLP
jgi:hypothetical protein